MSADAEAQAPAVADGSARARVPEPMVMDEPQAAVAFHEAGAAEGPLVPQYELCARSISKLLPSGGSVLDLGSGSARFLAYFAARRPDAEILGVELSQPMVSIAGEMLDERGLADRVRLIQADMTDCMDALPARLDLLSCTLALHQLPSERVLAGALREIAAIRERTGCAVWIWDLVRLQDDAVIQEWMSQAPETDALFHRDALASEAAAWTMRELEHALEQAGLGDLAHAGSQPPLLQAHWAPARNGEVSDGKAGWQDVPLPGSMRGRVMALRLGFTGLP